MEPLPLFVLSSESSGIPEQNIPMQRANRLRTHERVSVAKEVEKPCDAPQAASVIGGEGGLFEEQPL